MRSRKGKVVIIHIGCLIIYEKLVVLTDADVLSVILQHELLEGRFRFVDLYTRRSNRIGCFEISVAVVDADDESIVKLDHSLCLLCNNFCG